MLVDFLLLAPSGVHGWHLPWPLLQWTLTTPIGNLAWVALGFLVTGPPLVLLALWVGRHAVARARDVTEVPLAEWVSPRQTRLQPPLGQHWWGVGRRERVVSLVLLVLAVALAGGVGTSFF
jgi:hypothetical protein